MDVAAADLDKVGDNGLVIACEFCPNFILINDGSGKFANESRASLPQKRHDSEDIAAEDFGRDGDIDLVFVSEDTAVHEYYINDGKGHFTDATANHYKGENNFMSLDAQFMDLNGDG
jgi:hypothetical protein